MVTAKSFFQGAKQLPVTSLDRIVGLRGIVVVAPHPDDETLGCGGLIALAHDAGRAIRIIVVSDGCGSHPNSRSHPPNRLRDLRECETRAAVAALGLDEAALAFLRLPDRHVPNEGETRSALGDGVDEHGRAASELRVRGKARSVLRCHAEPNRAGPAGIVPAIWKSFAAVLVHGDVTPTICQETI